MLGRQNKMARQHRMCMASWSLTQNTQSGVQNGLLEITWRSELWVREGVGGGLVEEPSAAQRFVGAPAAEVGRLTN